MKRFLPHFGINPIIVKEIRSRMRGPRAFITLTVILLVTGGIMFAMLQIIMATSRYSSVLSPQVGQSMFAALAYLELFMVCAITPAVTAGAISAEKEKQTYEMLMATPLSPSRILLGKLISAMTYVFLLLFAAVPLASVVFIFGGVAPGDMLRALLVLVVIAITLGILGLFMSALFGRSAWATVASYVVVVILTVGPIFLTILVGVLRQSEPPRWLLAPSPLSALAAVLTPSMQNGMGGLDIFNLLGGYWFGRMGINPVSQTEIPRPLYHYSLPFYAGLSLVLYLITMRLVQPTRRFRLRRTETLVGIAVLVSFCALVGAGFYFTANRYEWALNGKVIEPTVEPMFIQPPMAMPAVAEEKRVVPVNPEDATPTPAEPAAMSETDIETMVEIYGAVARQLYTVDHTFGDKAPNWPVLYFIQATNDGVGDPNTVQLNSQLLDEKLQEGLRGALSDLPTEVRWAASSDDVPKDPQTGAVLEDGAIITFGNIHLYNDGTAHVPASLYFASLGATGKTYILSNEDGQWKVIGTTGVEWIS